MVALVLVVSGLCATAYGSWRGYLAARAALLPILRRGDATRTLVEAGRPVHERVRVRAAARSAALALGWLAIAMYGLYLVSVGLVVAG